MTYNVFGGTLSLTQSINQSTFSSSSFIIVVVNNHNGCWLSDQASWLGLWVCL